jgi:hypothetical protein
LLLLLLCGFWKGEEVPPPGEDEEAAPQIDRDDGTAKGLGEIEGEEETVVIW